MQASAGFAIAAVDEMAAVDWYTAPELANLPFIDLRPLAIEHLARRLRGEQVL